MEKLLFQHNIASHKTLKIVCGDMTATDQQFDVVVCSAFKGDYWPIDGTLIGALKRNKGIDLKQLSLLPQIDLKQLGGWLSAPIDGCNIKHVACVEIFDHANWFDYKYPNGNGSKIISADKVLCQTFSTMGFLLKQASFLGVEIKRIALPILGAGNQDIELEYVLPPLLAECKSLFAEIDCLQEIVFYELNANKANKFVQFVTNALAPSSKPDVFISYSTKNQQIANEMANILDKNNISYWMAPKSIPETSDYVKEIAKALLNVSLLLLVLTPQAEQSAWVPSEVSSAKGAKKPLLGIKPFEYDVNDEFAFLFQRSQIYCAYNDPNYPQTIADIVKRQLTKQS